MAPTNPNYVEKEEGWERRDDAPDATHTSRIDWNNYVTPERVEQMEKWAEEIHRDREERNG